MSRTSTPKTYRIPRDKVQVPHAVIYGHYEKLTNDELEELIHDLAHEAIRRARTAARH